MAGSRARNTGNSEALLRQSLRTAVEVRWVARKFAVVSAFAGREIRLPRRATRESAGYDFEAAEDVVLEPGKVTAVPTGVRVLMNEDEFLALYIRSSLSYKYSLMMANGTGIVDADYCRADNEGHIQFLIYNPTDRPVKIRQGERIGQGVFQKYLRTDDDAATGERTGGFGSTGV